jgi:hypothetical protein
MQTVSIIGLDIAKSVFQVHGVDANGLVVGRRQLKRRYVLAFFEKLPPGWHRGLCLITPLVARAAGTRPHPATPTSGPEAIRRSVDAFPDRRCNQVL